MAAREALPARYTVDRIGTPDPSNSRYWVLDIVNDYEARVTLARLGNNYSRAGKHELAEECWKGLDDSKDLHARAMEARNPKSKKPPKALSS